MNKLFWSLLSIGSASVATISFCGGYGLFSSKEKDSNAPTIGPKPPNAPELEVKFPTETTK